MKSYVRPNIKETWKETPSPEVVRKEAMIEGKDSIQNEPARLHTKHLIELWQEQEVTFYLVELLRFGDSLMKLLAYCDKSVLYAME